MIPKTYFGMQQGASRREIKGLCCKNFRNARLHTSRGAAFCFPVQHLGVSKSLQQSLRQWNASQDLLKQPLPSPMPEVVAEKPQKQPATYPTTFAVKSGNRVEIVPVESVLWIASSKDYVELHTARSTHLLRETMTSLTQRLGQEAFMRVHRSRIVRVDQIRELIPLENGEYRIRLQDGTDHRSSRTYASVLSDWMRRSTGQALPDQQLRAGTLIK